MNTINFNPSYVGKRNDILKLVPPNAKRVLDVGCSIGALGLAIKENTGAMVVGIELSREMAKIAEQKLDKVFVDDVEEILAQEKLQDFKFDTIILADLLEHLRDPWSVLESIVSYLEPQGILIASIPNVRHINTIFNLVLKGYWPYRDRGIHDRAHLRFFTKRNINELFTRAGLSIDRIEANYRIIERPHKLNRFAKFLAIPGLRHFLTFQYLLLARLTGAAPDRCSAPLPRR
jgi:2-polyprenyl-3-methyl-5-hydroxy-6-metoxy-1,4-benzoquinol methylase